jgi:hypothetical protein
MDTNTFEPEQEAAAPACILQQQLHVEVVDSKSSVDLSDEEKLAVGVSTTRLQTKRLSGAQWKRLTRERKIKEGTWTDKFPPRKTPSSQEMGAVGSSGSVKGPDSDSSTSSLEKQQPKKPRNTGVQTGAYKKALAGIKMAVIHRHHPDVKLDQAEADLIQLKLLSAVDANASREAPPQFLYSKFAHGIFWITCANEPSKVWLMRAMSGLGEFWEGAELTVVNTKDLPKRPRVLVRIRDTSEFTTVLTRLGIQNPGLNMTDWSVMSRKITEKEQTLAFSVDPDSFKALTK